MQWSSREAAERAAASMPEIPEAAAMTELIDEIVSFEHCVDGEPAGAAYRRPATSRDERGRRKRVEVATSSPFFRSVEQSDVVQFDQ